MRRFTWIALFLLILAACTPSTETAVSPSPTAQAQPTALPTNTIPPPVIAETAQEVATAVPELVEPTKDPTAAPPEPTPEAVADVGVISGRTEEGAFFLGDPNAPITHIDYSDFL